MKLNGFYLRIIVVVIITLTATSSSAQTDVDADMMAKNLICVGPMYSYSSWNNYWEGTHKRNNRNLGTISTQTFSLMGNYGISKKLNFLFNIPYVQTKASAGTLHGMKGIQDLALMLKWKPVAIISGRNRFAVVGVAGLSTPVSDYVADFLPLSIGMKSQTVSGRIMADYQFGNVFATASAAYVVRSNITIDRDSYYTTSMHMTNKVEMPGMSTYNIRAGYRTKFVVAEAVLNRMNTLGGFDISRNNMPFPGNRMNMTTAGLNFRYIPKNFQDLNFNAGASQTVAGRNVGQSAMYYGGVFYIFHLARKSNAVFNFKSDSK
jgi:hypothetical protein